jgi:hypothetical protein
MSSTGQKAVKVKTGAEYFFQLMPKFDFQAEIFEEPENDFSLSMQTIPDPEFHLEIEEEE